MRKVTVVYFVVVVPLMILFLDQLPSQANSTDSVPAPSPEWARQSTLRGSSGWLDSLFPFLSGASRVADYAAVSRVVRLS